MVTCIMCGEEWKPGKLCKAHPTLRPCERPLMHVRPSDAAEAARERFAERRNNGLDHAAIASDLQS